MPLDAQAVARARAAVPAAVRELPGWVLWRFEQSGSKQLKVPHYSSGVKRNGTQNTPEDCAQLVTFEQAVEAARKLTKQGMKFDGLGFAPRPEFRLIGLDLDNKQADPALARLHDRLVGLAAGAYVETSPSGKGRHIWLAGNGLADAKYHGVGVEVFAGKGYLTVTGDGPAAALVEMPAALRAELGRAVAIEKLAPHWKEPKRHTLALALSGAMLSSGHAIGDVEAFIAQLAALAGDGEVADRLAAARTTARAIAEGKPATGVPKLAELIGEQPLQEVKRWLGLGDSLHGIRVGGAPPIEDGGELIVRQVSEVIEEPVRWLWPNRIARGKLSMIAGKQGLSKSTLTCEVAAIVSRADLWPLDGTRAEPGEVLILNVEDDAGDTIRPRLRAAGAVLERVHIIEGIRRASGGQRLLTFADVEVLDRYLVQHPGRFALLVCDPVGAFLAGRDSHKDAEVRELLAPLKSLAERHNVAVLLVAHLNKAQGASALDRVIGSVAFTAAVRALYILVSDPGDEGRLLLLPEKASNAPAKMLGLSYRLQSADLGGGIVAPRIVWEGSESRSADQVLNPPREAPERDEAEAWVRDRLGGGAVPVKELQQEVREAGLGFSWRTVETAKKQLGVASSRTVSGWQWSLPTPQDRKTVTPQGQESVADLPESSEKANTAGPSGHCGVTALRPCGLDDDAEVL